MDNQTRNASRGDEIKNKNVRFVILREGLIHIQICCNLSPEEMRERKKEVEALLPFAGTTKGWHIILEGDNPFDEESLLPVPCADDEGHWHYICLC